MTLCDLDDVTCTARPGYHFSLQVKPAAGYQIIRFPGVEDVLAIHLLDDRGEEILDLPQVQPDRWN
jgi:adenosine/AMP kinase